MSLRTAIPTAAVVAGLGALAAVALTSQRGGDGSAAAAATAPPPRVRTVRVVEVHTITRVRRDLPPARPRVAAVAPPPQAPAPAPAAAAPVAREAPVAQPLRTRASGAPGARREDDGGEHEGHGQDD